MVEALTIAAAIPAPPCPALATLDMPEVTLEVSQFQQKFYIFFIIKKTKPKYLIIFFASG